MDHPLSLRFTTYGNTHRYQLQDNYRNYDTCIELFEMAMPRNSTVIGPANMSLDGKSPPQFITNVTNKIQYRDADHRNVGIHSQ